MKIESDRSGGYTLIVTRFFPPAQGGTETTSFELARGLSRLGRKVAVVTPHAAGDALFDPQLSYPVLRVAGAFCRWIRLYRLYRSTWAALCRYPVEAVIATTWSPSGIVAYLLQRKKRIPYLVMAHGTELYAHRPWNWLRSRVLRSAARVAANSTFTRDRLIKIGVPSSRIAVVHPAVDIRKFQKRRAWVPEGAGPGVPTILTVTRLTPKKGIDTVLKALPEVRKRAGAVRYVVVGEGEDRERLERMAGELGLSDTVYFAGRVSDDELISWYQNCDLFVLVSREERGGADYEGFGIVFLEAGACGTPVVGGRSGGIPDAVEDGVTGILVDPADEGEAAGAIIALLTDTKLAGEMGEAGRRRVAEKFSYLSQARRYHELLGVREGTRSLL